MTSTRNTQHSETGSIALFFIALVGIAAMLYIAYMAISALAGQPDGIFNAMLNGIAAAIQ